MSRRRRGLLLTSGLLLLLCVLGLIALWWGWRRHVVEDPGEHISRHAILEIISEESPVFTSDGEHRLGVFFAQEHRDYVPFDEIPRSCVAALVAAEDKRFFTHHGIDPMGITRAMWMNLQAGGLVAGGSTLTQQTAKNLYYRPDRSLQSKWTELLNALRLEAHYSKDEILEFYFNQFHVSGNGRGLGIAARYFFDEEVARLGVQECAFLAGMVKAPARYNPWSGRTDEHRQRARQAAAVRTAYVLGRMVETGAISQQEHDELVAQPLPFVRGHFRYERSVLLDAVEERLSRYPFPEVFTAAGIDNPSTAGLQIITTLDHDAQESAVYGLWHHLSELGPYLDGAGIEVFRLPEGDAQGGPLAEIPRPRQFLPGVVQAVEGEGEQRTLLLDLGGAPAGGERLVCRVDREGLERAAAVLLRAREADHRARVGQADVDSLLAALSSGTALRTSLREDGEQGLICDLEASTELQGAVLVLQRGRIRAMVGGGDNRNFNRATQAERQLGSTWKPLIYHAALQLGWEPDDILDNRRNVFPFEGTWYYPRPDHDPEPAVSLAWAGTRSENLASIWLLFHLVDRLNPEQVRRLAELVGLWQQPGEGRKAYIVRIRDEYGVIALDSRREETLFDAARQAALADLAFTGHAEDEFELRTLHHGRGFATERARVMKSSGGAERRARLEALRRNFVELDAHAGVCRRQFGAVGSPLEWAVEEFMLGDVEPADVSWLYLRELDGELLCASEDPGAGHLPLAAVLDDPVALQDWTLLSRATTASDLLVDGVLHLSTVDALRVALDRQLQAHAELDPWEPELLYQHTDFRRMLSMRYLALLARSMGVEAEIPPVLSMPLGATEVSLVEAAQLYQGLLQGSSWRFPGMVYTEGTVPGLRQVTPLEADASSTCLIQEIRDRHGAILYRAGQERVQVVDEVPGLLVADVLSNVVRWGTGRRASGKVTVGGRSWPLMGKTGTTNAYRNAAFLGFAPVAKGGQLDPAASYTVAAYVGYDDNRSMRRGTLRVSGASGALPAWIGTIQGMAAAGLLADDEELDEELAFPAPADMGRLAVEAGSGLPVGGEPVERSILAPEPGTRSGRRFGPVEPPADLPWGEPTSWSSVEAPAADPAAAEPDAGEAASVWDAIEASD